VPGIKSFLYLDEYKMYSISSQIFEGITESWISIRGTSTEEEERQSGPFASGRVIAEISQQGSQQQERKYLHDYSYTLFEQHIKANRSIPSITSENIEEFIPALEGINFVEVRATPIFNDMNIILSTIKKFNDLGEAITFFNNAEEIVSSHKTAAELERTTTDRNQRVRVRAQIQQQPNIADLADAAGLRQDPELLDHLAFMLEYGFQDQFEIQMPVGRYIFSANLKREYLREDEHLLVRKFSRLPDRDFVLFGTVAQAPTPADESGDDTGDSETLEPKNIKQVMMQLIESLSDIEANFTGRLTNEVVVDPIAVYREF
jgi:hypothetical protein